MQKALLKVAESSVLMIFKMYSMFNPTQSICTHRLGILYKRKGFRFLEYGLSERKLALSCLRSPALNKAYTELEINIITASSSLCCPPRVLELEWAASCPEPRTLSGFVRDVR